MPFKRRLPPLLALSLALSWVSILHPQQHFTDSTATRLPSMLDTCSDAEFGDIDGDGNIDLFLAESSSSPVPNRLWQNEGGGSFQDVTDSLLTPVGGSLNSSDCDFGDVDRDGDLDLFVSNWDERNQILINGGGGSFTDGGARFPTDIKRYSEGADLGDIDGDLDLDILVVNFNDQRALIYLNDGSGDFDWQPESRFPSGTYGTHQVDFGDVDGDFDLDAIVANGLGDLNQLMINDGSGWFVDESPQRIPEDDQQSNDVEFGDVDGDGDLDILVVNGFFPGIDKVWINDGSGHFVDETEQRLPGSDGAGGEVDLGDVDNDGDLDLVIANLARGGLTNRLYINDGRGYFTDETSLRFPIIEEETLDVEFGDVDDDGDLDLLIANAGIDFVGEQNRLLINQSTPDSFPPKIPRTYHHPDTPDTSQPYLITTTVWDNIGVVVGDLRVSLFYRGRGDTSGVPHPGPFTEIPMKDSGGFLYRERIPPQPTGTRVEYYIRAQDRMGNVALAPPAAPDSVVSFVVDVALGIGDDPGGTGARLPKAFSLAQNYPNPFNPSTTIDYEIPAPAAAGAGLGAGRGGPTGSGGGGGSAAPSPSGLPDGTVPVDLRIYDLRGRLVRTLLDEERAPGRHAVHWDGRDNHGESVGSGVYLYRLQAGAFVSTKKMIVTQ